MGYYWLRPMISGHVRERLGDTRGSVAFCGMDTLSSNR